MKPIPVHTALAEASRHLSERSTSPRLDAEVLLAWILGQSRSHLHCRPERRLAPPHLRAFYTLVQRRAAGEPIAYLTGRCEFWSLTLEVTPATLVPRPETERLVELALRHIPAEKSWRIADLGTGSGAVALALAHERPACLVTATDLSATALDIARRNAQRLGIGNIEFLRGDWFAPLAGRRFDLIVSNPPYVREHDPHLKQDGLPFEPVTALVSGEQGTEALEALAGGARAHLKPNGWLLLEHGYEQGAAILELLHKHRYDNIQGYRDLAGLERVAMGQHVAQPGP